MNLTPITTRKESKVAYDKLRACLKAGAVRFQRSVGWPGAHGEFTLYWHEKERFWVLFNPDERYWSAYYGAMNPNEHRSLEITCEINPPTEGIDRRYGGIFLKDSGSRLYLAHSGKVAGGRKGIGKTAFLETYGGETEEIEWPDGVTGEVVILGKIGGKAFLSNLASYIKAVEDFKADATGRAPKEVTQKNPDLGFKPEFEGPRKKYKLTDAIESKCYHGIVVNTLQRELASMGLAAGSNRNIDLYVEDGKSNITHVFEVKTDQCTTSIYQAVGQVMLHSALVKKAPHRILVLPGKASAKTEIQFGRLGIQVLSYGWKNEKPVFAELTSILKN